ncbi:MAG: Gfo/Idh/MocA family oxidoreductase [Kosmotogaceae bacterium]
MKKIRLGIVGTGIAARDLHLPALKQLSDKYQITALASRTRSKAEKLANMIEPRPKVLENYDELLKSNLVDVIDITVPIHLNPEFIQKALAYGYDVICEKPLGANMHQARQVLNSEKNTNRIVYIAENFRHIKAFKEAKQLIESGEIGDPSLLIWHEVKLAGKDAKYVNTEWRKDPKHIGGFISDGGVHHIAAIRQIMGDIKSVTAIQKTVRSYLGSTDTLSANFAFESGAIGNYTVSFGLNTENNPKKAIGTEGEIVIESEVKLVLDNEKGENIIDLPEENSYKNEFDDFYEVYAEKKDNNLGNVIEAAKDLATIEAALLSAKTSKTIEVNDLL